MLYEDSFTPVTYDCKIYMKQKEVTIDPAAAAKADAKIIYLHSYGGEDVSLLEGYPNPGFSPRIFTVEGNIDERIRCFLTDINAAKNILEEGLRQTA